MPNVLAPILALLVLAPGAATAETWVPSTNTAISITGKVKFTAKSIVFQNGTSMPIAAASEAGLDGQVFKVVHPVDPVLLRGNKLCGNAPVTFFVVTKGDNGSRALAVYTSRKAPLQDDSGCATYGYQVGR